MQTKYFPNTSLSSPLYTATHTASKSKSKSKSKGKLKMKSKLGLVGVCVVVVMVLGEVEMAKAASCNPLQLSPCASAIMSAGNPTAVCCAKIKEQRPCLCQYMKNPNLQKFINSPGAKKVATSCGTPFPKC